MNSRRYWKNRLPFLLTNLVCMAALTVFLLVCGNSVSAVVLILIVWALILLTGLVLTYWKRKRQMKKLLDMAEQLSERYLISEVMELPEQAEDQVYYQLLKMAGKSMLEQIGEVERERLEYKEYIEQWIHEIKVPITGIQLLCENNKTEITRKIITQTELIEQNVERVLFYARLGNVEKDYLIKEISLKQCVMEMLARNKQFLIQNGVCVDTEVIPDTVYSDNKWVCFILNQIIFNSIKYRGTEPLVIHIQSQDMGNYVSLSITDNGIGIKPSELCRVFDKGFIGSNGRTEKNSTGIGLYLCDQLCAKYEINTMKTGEQKQRYFALDRIRAIALLNMIAYHTIWDLVYLFGFGWKWFQSDVAYIWQQAICWTFIFLSGFCQSLGNETLKRGLQISFVGLLISVVTNIVIPQSRVLFSRHV